MRVKVLAIGKIKEPYVREALADYEKRIKPYARLEIIEGPEEDANCGDTAKVLGKEGAFFLRHLERDVFAIALDLEGKALTSPDLAALLEEKGNMEGKEIAFLIGGSLGLSQKVKKPLPMSAFLWESDISPPVDPCFSVGTDLPLPEDPQKRTVS